MALVDEVESQASVTVCSGLRVVADHGAGRRVVLLYEPSEYGRLAEQVGTVLASTARVLAIESARVSGESWSALTEALTQMMNEQKVRVASFVAFGACTTLLQNLCLRDLRLVRTAIFVDPEVRPHPTVVEQVLDRLERMLPLGLPLRVRTRGFDGRSFLQRIRCPALVVRCSSSAHAGAQAALLARGLPTAWFSDLSAFGGVQAAEVASKVCAFQEMPARCPQKNLR